MRRRVVTGVTEMITGSGDRRVSAGSAARDERAVPATNHVPEKVEAGRPPPLRATRPPVPFPGYLARTDN